MALGYTSCKPLRCTDVLYSLANFEFLLFVCHSTSHPRVTIHNYLPLTCTHTQQNKTHFAYTFILSTYTHSSIYLYYYCYYYYYYHHHYHDSPSPL